jgi:hypothetical protein
MTLPSPQNHEEAGYLAIATVSKLLNLLINKGVLRGSDITNMLGLVAERLEKEPNFNSQRAARSLTEWMSSKD